MRTSVFLLVVVLVELALLLLIHLDVFLSSKWRLAMLIGALMCLGLDFIVDWYKQDVEDTDDTSVLDEHYEALK